MQFGSSPGFGVFNLQMHVNANEKDATLEHVVLCDADLQATSELCPTPSRIPMTVASRFVQAQVSLVDCLDLPPLVLCWKCLTLTFLSLIHSLN